MLEKVEVARDSFLCRVDEGCDFEALGVFVQKKNSMELLLESRSDIEAWRETQPYGYYVLLLGAYSVPEKKAMDEEHSDLKSCTSALLSFSSLHHRAISIPTQIVVWKRYSTCWDGPSSEQVRTGASDR